MKPFLFLALLTALTLSTHLQATEAAIQVKRHREHSKFSERPFGNRDLSYGAFIEFFEGTAGWRIGAMYANDISKGDPESEDFIDVKSVITPELTLLIQDGMWETGISVLKDYIETEDDRDWGGTYFQLQLGFNFPVSANASVGLHALYPFDSFSDVTKFKFSDVDIGLLARIRF